MSRPYRRGKKIWIEWRDPDLGSVRESTPAKNLTEGKLLAQEKERAAWRRANNLEPELGPDKLFEERAWEWWRQLPKEYRSKGTAETYLRQRVLPFLGKRACRSITREHVRAMLLANEEDRPGKMKIRSGKEVPFVLKGASTGTREKCRAYVHAIFEWLIEDLEEVRSRNPAGGKRMRVRGQKRLPRFIPLPELVTLFHAIPWHERLLCVFAIVAGPRRGELRAAHMAGRRPRVPTRPHLQVGELCHHEGGRERHVPIPKWLVPVFQAEKDRKLSQFVFPNVKGKRRRNDVKMTRVLRQAAKLSGLITGYSHVCRRQGCGWREERPDVAAIPCPECTFKSWVEPIPKRYIFKDLRSPFGTHASAAGADPRWIQLVLGHANFSTSEGSYINSQAHALVAGLDKISAFDVLAPTVRNLCVAANELTSNGVNPNEYETQQSLSE